MERPRNTRWYAASAEVEVETAHRPDGDRPGAAADADEAGTVCSRLQLSRSW